MNKANKVKNSASTFSTVFLWCRTQRSRLTVKTWRLRSKSLSSRCSNSNRSLKAKKISDLLKLKIFRINSQTYINPCRIKLVCFKKPSNRQKTRNNNKLYQVKLEKFHPLNLLTSKNRLDRMIFNSESLKTR